MATLLLPVVPIAAEDKYQRFLSLLNNVADETWKQEPDCLAYCWLVSASPSDMRVCGFEMYSNSAALTVTHRAGWAYGAFKMALQSEQLAPPPAADDLRFWSPVERLCDNGLTKANNDHDTQLYFLVTRYHVNSSERRDALLDELSSDCSEPRTTPKTRIVATALECHDVVKVDIWKSVGLEVVMDTKRSEEFKYVKPIMASVL